MIAQSWPLPPSGSSINARVRGPPPELITPDRPAGPARRCEALDRSGPSDAPTDGRDAVKVRSPASSLSRLTPPTLRPGPPWKTGHTHTHPLSLADFFFLVFDRAVSVGGGPHCHHNAISMTTLACLRLEFVDILPCLAILFD